MDGEGGGPPGRCHKIKLSGELPATGGVVLDKPAAPPMLVEIMAADEVTATESTVLDGRGSDSEVIRIARDGADGRSASADREADGSVSISLAGPRRVKRASELRAANLLVERLNRDGGVWEPPISCDEERERTGAAEDGVDCLSRGPDGELKIQVTTPETEAWQELARAGQVDHRNSSADALIEAIWASVERKRHVSGRSDVVLALDATDCPTYSFRSVVAAFRRTLGRDAAAVGYSSIWMVGPVVDLVQRLDS